MTTLLSQEQLALLTDEELEVYQALLEAEEREWTLTPRQELAEALSAEVDVLLYGGAAGGGKTDWLMWHAFQQSIEHPGHTTLALRRTFPQLKDSLIRRSLEKFDQKAARYMVGDKEWVFENGSTIRFAYCDSEEDYRHYLSAEYDLIVFEELTEFSELQFKMIRSRCRTTQRKRARGIRPHVIAATNPGQVGHEWVKSYFVTSTSYGKDVATITVEVMGRKRDLTVGFVPAKVTDNPHIDPDYVFNLASLPEIERRQYLDGDWDIFEGQYFTEWSAEVHVVRPFPVPLSWTRVRAIDYGIAKPFCCLWGAVDHDGNVWVYREAYGTGHTAKEQARLILQQSVVRVEADDGSRDVRPELIGKTVADPSIWQRQGTGVSIDQQYRLEGLHCQKAMNARIDGWSRVRDYLRAETTPKLGDGTPNPHHGPVVRVFSTCTNLIRTLPVMIHDKKHPEDLDTDLEDHAADALRYLLMSRPRHPLQRQRQPKTAEEREWARLRGLDRKGGRRRPVHEVLGRL